MVRALTFKMSLVVYSQQLVFTLGIPFKEQPGDTVWL